ncbi:MAG: hypothetical protein ACE5HP_00205 [Gemmatimonadota bacterium]
MIRALRLLPWLALLPGTLVAQGAARIDDGRLPRRGRLWLEVHPSFENWRDQFARNSPDPTVSDGEREPLFRDLDGPILGRIFPSIQEELVQELNADGPALGFDPLSVDDVSVGSLEFGSLNVQARRLTFLARFGILNRLSVEVGAPLVLTEVEPLFAFDSAAATVARLSEALPDADSFLGGFGAARSSLQGLIDGGTLTTSEEAAARALLGDAGAFLAALEARVAGDRFFPLGSSAAGTQIAAHFGSLADGFAAFGIPVPALALREVASSLALRSLFSGDPLFAVIPGVTERGFDVGEADAGLRFGILDTFRDTTARLRLRTTVGARLRFPIRDVNRPPFLDPADFFDLPIGDGQTDVELGAYQDVQLGDSFHLNATAFLGLQLSDEVILRVHPPDRPFALPETRAALRRDLGDYVQVRIAPQLMLNRTLSVGLEYGVWHKGEDRFRLLEGETAVPDARPLELETAETRQRFGVGAFYRIGNPGRGERPGSPWLLGITYRTAVSGSGGQTPRSGLFTVTLRAAP